MATHSRSIERLNEENYETWKIHMRSALILDDLWQYVDGTAVKPTTNAEKWMKNDWKASKMMNLNITSGQLHHIKRAITSKQAWDILKNIPESRGPVRKTTLFQQLLRTKMTTNTTMTQHITEFVTKAEQIAEAGMIIQDDLLSIMLFGYYRQNTKTLLLLSNPTMCPRHWRF